MKTFGFNLETVLNFAIMKISSLSLTIFHHFNVLLFSQGHDMWHLRHIACTIKHRKAPVATWYVSIHSSSLFFHHISCFNWRPMDRYCTTCASCSLSFLAVFCVQSFFWSVRYHVLLTGCPSLVVWFCKWDWFNKISLIHKSWKALEKLPVIIFPTMIIIDKRRAHKECNDIGECGHRDSHT